MEINGKEFIGHGLSIKAAERDSAISYIKYNNIPWSNEINVDLNVKVDYQTLIKNIRTNSEPRLTALLKTYMLPLWSEPILDLSLTHRSYTGQKAINIFGKDNTLLAFIGAYLIQWVAHDTILSSLTIRDITRAGGISVLATLLVSNQKLEDIFEKTFSNCPVKVGPGERIIHFTIKSEFIQAICGVVFLVREMELCKAKDFFYGITPLQEYFNAATNRLCISREESFPIKSILLEQCQSLGLKLSFETRRKIIDKKINI